MNNNMDNNNSQQDWFKASLIFVKALGYMLTENQGIVIDLNEMTKLEGHDDLTKVIVFRKEEQIHIAPCEDDLEEGTFVSLTMDDLNSEENTEIENN